MFFDEGNEQNNILGGIQIPNKANKVEFPLRNYKYNLLSLSDCILAEDPVFLALISDKLSPEELTGLWQSFGKGKQYFSHVAETKISKEQLGFNLLSEEYGEVSLKARAVLTDVCISHPFFNNYDIQKSHFLASTHVMDFHSRNYYVLQPFVKNNNFARSYYLYLLVFALFIAKQNYRFLVIDNNDSSLTRFKLEVLSIITPTAGLYKLDVSNSGEKKDFAYILDPFDI